MMHPATLPDSARLCKLFAAHKDSHLHHPRAFLVIASGGAIVAKYFFAKYPYPEVAEVIGVQAARENRSVEEGSAAKTTDNDDN